MSKKPAPFIWYDVMTPDVAGATAFYGKVVGWNIADSGMPGMSYSILNAGGTMVGGIMPVPEGSGLAPMWTGYVYSPDVDADAKNAAKLGGMICKEPQDIPGVGRFAVIADPGGAMFNLFKPSTDQSPTEVERGTPGHIEWHDLRAGDGKKAWDFYSKLFGWSKTDAMDMGDNGVYQMFSTGKDGSTGGIMTKKADTPKPLWTFFFNVDAIDAAAQRVTGNGGKVLMEPMEVPGGQWIIEASDPQGASFGLVALKR